MVVLQDAREDVSISALCFWLETLQERACRSCVYTIYPSNPLTNGYPIDLVLQRADERKAKNVYIWESLESTEQPNVWIESRTKRSSSRVYGACF